MTAPLLTEAEFTDALIRLLDDSADDADRATIDAALVESDSHRHLYRDLMLTESALAWGRRKDQTTAAAPKPDAEARRSVGISAPAPGSTPISAAGAPIYRKGHEPQPARIRPHHYAIAAVAATLLAACGLAIYVYVSSLPHSEIPDHTSPPPLATLIESRGGTLTTPHGYPAEGEDFSAGEYTLSSGDAEFMLTNAVNVKLRGNTRMVMRNNMNVALTRGSAQFVVPPGATGFTVQLPDASRVVDLGTEFRVRVADDHALLTVKNGEVRWLPPESDDAAEPVSLTTGAMARIVNGRLVEIPIAIALAGSQWPPTLSEPDADAAYIDGKVRFTGTQSPGPTMIRTHRSDYHRHDWIAHFVFTLDDPAATNSPVFIGIGPGTIDADKYHAPVARPNVLIAFRTDHRSIHAFDNTDTPALIETDTGRVVHKFADVNDIAGPHRVRIQWNAKTKIASFAYDHGNDRKIEARFNIDASNNKFTPDTARVFFGGDRATLTTFKIITPDPNVGPDAQSLHEIRHAD